MPFHKQCSNYRTILSEIKDTTVFFEFLFIVCSVVWASIDIITASDSALFCLFISNTDHVRRRFSELDVSSI